MRFTINLATKTYINHRAVNGVILASASILLLLLFWNAQRAITAVGERDKLKAEIEAYEAKLNSLPAGVSDAEFRNMQSNIRFYNGIIEKRSADWLGLLGKLEKATPAGIALTVLTPEPKTGEIKIEGEAKSFDGVRNYLEKLEESKSFRDIQILSHQNSLVGEKSSGVKFAISLQAVQQ
jgi:type IV pilus assembly protein PilN